MSIRILWLPSGATEYRLTLRPLPAIGCLMPAREATIQDAYAGEHTIAVPALWLTMEGVVSDNLWYLLAQRLTPDAAVECVPYRLANVFPDGDVCWGPGSGPGSGPKTPREAWQRFWMAPFNRDLFDYEKDHGEWCESKGEVETQHECHGRRGCRCDVDHDCVETHRHRCGEKDDDGQCEPECRGQEHGEDGHGWNAIMVAHADMTYHSDGSAYWTVPYSGRETTTQRGDYVARYPVFSGDCACCERECDHGVECDCCAEDCDCHTDDSCPCGNGECECSSCRCESGDCDCAPGCSCDIPGEWIGHLKSYDPCDETYSEWAGGVRPLAGIFPESARLTRDGPEAVLVFDEADAEKVPAAWSLNGTAMCFARRVPRETGLWDAWCAGCAGSRGINGPFTFTRLEIPE